MSLIRDNNIILRKLLKSYNFSNTYVRCDLNHCRVGMNVDTDYVVSYLPVFKVDKDCVVFVEDKDDIYVCLDLDKVCTMSNLKFCHGVSDSLDIDNYMTMNEVIEDSFKQYKSIMSAKISHHSFRNVVSDIVEFMNTKYHDVFDLQTLMTSKGFDLAIQYIKGNSLQDDFFEYIHTSINEKLSNYIQCMLKGKKTLNVTKDVYFKDNIISFARINFKDMRLYVYDGGYFDKVTVSSQSNHVCIYDIDGIIKMIKSISNLMFEGVRNLFPNLEDN